ncbi:5c7548f3-fa18-4774-90c6-780829676d14 [Thermothielavioides terrestris]|uniref:5c7548f3-fa18-4774-90c6-780829676d14 n=1 Tax=Thermothielavioides terrestris TaxID=2587410 RepID=A0A446BBJ6_9PEZI|nr:5c7548f3-fa18-4774-90c6-780829676d14 [Thermothielavioides terrestris]
MKSSALLAACSALLAAASPILQGRRLYISTDVVTEWVTVTVTEGDTSTAFSRPVPHTKATTTTSIPEPSTTSVAPPPPPPPPTSTSAPVIQAAPQPTQQPSPSPQAADPQVQAAQPSSDTPAPAPAPSTTTQASAAQPSDYTSTALYHHNVHRFNHSANALVWSDEHAQYAQTLAERCVFEHDTSIGGGGYGQNIAMWGSTGDPEAFGATGSIARAASNGWYNGELNDFPASSYGASTPDMTNFEKWGHFSQLVWKDTQKVGCATVFCQPGTLSSMGSWFSVCNYYPPGNVGGAYGDNVAPPEGQPIVTAA